MSYVSVSPGLGALPASSLTLTQPPPVKAPIRTPIRTPIVRTPVAQPTPSPTPPAPALPEGPPQPLASIFVKKLTELVAKGLLDEEVKDLQKLLPMTEEQLRALVATAESKGKKGATGIRAAFEQSIAELAAMKADESKKKALIAGGVAVAAAAAFFFMRRKKS